MARSRYWYSKGISRTLDYSKEVKYVDQLSTSINQLLTLSPVFTALNIPVIGTNFFNRVGNKITMRSLYFTGFIAPNNGNSSGLVAGDYIRILVVYDLQPNKAFPAFADLIMSTNVNGTTSSTALDHVSINNRKRFIILMDERFQVGSVGGSGVLTPNAVFMQPENLLIKRYIKLKNLQTVYLATAGTVADISQGSLFLCTVSLTATSSNSAYSLYGSTRLAYVD